MVVFSFCIYSALVVALVDDRESDIEYVLSSTYADTASPSLLEKLNYQLAFAVAVAKDNADVVEKALFEGSKSDTYAYDLGRASENGGKAVSSMLLGKLSSLSSQQQLGVLHGAMRNGLDIETQADGLTRTQLNSLALTAIESGHASLAQEFTATLQTLEDGVVTGVSIIVAAKLGYRNKSASMLAKYDTVTDEGELLAPTREVVCAFLRAGDADRGIRIANTYIEDELYGYMLHREVIEECLAGDMFAIANQYCDRADATFAGALELLEASKASRGEKVDAVDPFKSNYFLALGMANDETIEREALDRAVNELVCLKSDDSSEVEIYLDTAQILLGLSYRAKAPRNCDRLFSFILTEISNGYRSEYFSTPAGRPEVDISRLTKAGILCSTNGDFVKVDKISDMLSARIGAESALFPSRLRIQAIMGAPTTLSVLKSENLSTREQLYCSFCFGYGVQVRAGRGAPLKLPIRSGKDLLFAESVGKSFRQLGHLPPLPYRLMSLESEVKANR